MATAYNTIPLPLSVEVQSLKSRKPAYAIVALVLVAMAGAATFLVSGAGSAASVSDYEPFSAIRGDDVTCHKDRAGFLPQLPWYQPGMDSEDAFYNACYYSYRCCSTTNDSEMCYVSEHLGIKCYSCLLINGPRMASPACLDYMNHVDENGDPWDATTEQLESNAPEYDLKSLREDKIPQPETPDLILKFKNKETCWPQAGPKDRRMKEYETDCFRVLSWCNQLCPRNRENTAYRVLHPNDERHILCKHCTLFGYDQAEPPITARKIVMKEKGDELKRQQLAAVAAEFSAWKSRWTLP